MELIPPNENLPIIENCQVSSTLSNFDNNTNAETNQMENVDFIILQSAHDFKSSLNLSNSNYMVLKKPSSNDVNSIGITDKINSSTQENHITTNVSNKVDVNNSNNIPDPFKEINCESFENILYFVCNLCSYLCTRESKIVEHLRNAHKNKISSKLIQLKCPACVNIFFYQESLKSHLLYDHGVTDDDINRITQAVVFYSYRNNKINQNDNDINNFKEIIKSNECNKGFATFSNKNDNINFIQNKVTEFHLKNTDGILTKKLISLRPNIDMEEEEPTNFDAQNITPSPSNIIYERETAVNVQNDKINLLPMTIDPHTNEKSTTTLTINESTVLLATKKNCSQCKIVLKDSNKMDYHIKSHLKLGGFQCLECQEKSTSWKSLISHLWRSHKIDMELYSCDRCDYKTNSLSRLNTTHKYIHSNVKAYQCEVCQKAFKNQKQVRNHRKIHRKDLEKKTFKCEICTKVSTDGRQLQKHMDIVHKQLKPFLCNYCGYKGSSRGSLKMHIRCHTGEKPFKCDQCVYSSADHNSLRRHKLRHTGDKPYKCSYCSYACIQSSTYKVHLKTKHPGLEKDLMFTCQNCQFRTVNKQMYNMHMINVHNQSIEREASIS